MIVSQNAIFVNIFLSFFDNYFMKCKNHKKADTESVCLLLYRKIPDLFSSITSILTARPDVSCMKKNDVSWGMPRPRIRCRHHIRKSGYQLTGIGVNAPDDFIVLHESPL